MQIRPGRLASYRPTSWRSHGKRMHPGTVLVQVCTMVRLPCTGLIAGSGSGSAVTPTLIGLSPESKAGRRAIHRRSLQWRAGSAVLWGRCTLCVSDADDCLDAALNIGLRGGRRGNADAHGRGALPDSAPAPAFTIGLDGRDNPAGDIGFAKGNQHLIEHDLIEDTETGCSKPFGKVRGITAMPLHQVCQTCATKCTQRGPDLDAPGAPGDLRRVVGRLARFPTGR